MTFLDGLARILARFRDPAALVPQHHRAAPIFALWDRAFEPAIVERMVLGAHGKPILAGIETRPLGYPPPLDSPIKLDAEVPVQAPSVVLLLHEAIALALELAVLGLLR